jgi:hypothetical protein
MRRTVFAVALLALAAGAAAAQNPPPKPPPKPAATISIPAAAVGVWDAKSMTGPKDSVITTYVMTATATTSGWTTKLATRPIQNLRIIAAGGDSVVTEMGPYESVLRPGQQVTTRTTAHFKGDAVTGTFEAKFTNGDVVKGKTTGTRKK